MMHSWSNLSADIWLSIIWYLSNHPLNRLNKVQQTNWQHPQYYSIIFWNFCTIHFSSSSRSNSIRNVCKKNLFIFSTRSENHLMHVNKFSGGSKRVGGWFSILHINWIWHLTSHSSLMVLTEIYFRTERHIMNAL